MIGLGAEWHPELVITFMEGPINLGRRANEHKLATAAILDKQTFYLDIEDSYRGIEHIDTVPNLRRRTWLPALSARS